jgi:hypothetical protein
MRAPRFLLRFLLRWFSLCCFITLTMAARIAMYCLLAYTMLVSVNPG